MILPPTLVLLRHAWAGERGAVPDDRTRPLDRRGAGQAAALLGHLDAALLARDRPRLSDRADHTLLLSSPLVRCTATLAPMAAELGIPIVTDDRLAEVPVPLTSRDGWPDAAYLGARALGALADAGARTTGDAVLVVCAHGEILPALVAALAGQQLLAAPVGVDLTSKRLPKGACWLLAAVRPGRAAVAPCDIEELDAPP